MEGACLVREKRRECLEIHRLLVTQSLHIHKLAHLRIRSVTSAAFLRGRATSRGAGQRDRRAAIVRVATVDSSSDNKPRTHFPCN